MPGFLRRLVRTPTKRRDSPESSLQAEGADHFAEIVCELSVGVITFNGKGRLTWINTAAEEMFDLMRRPVLGRVIIEVVPSIELDRRVHAALNGQTWSGSIELTSPGGVRHLVVSVRPFAEEPGAMLTVSDQTRLHELEQTRRDFFSNVAHELRTPLSSIKLMVETITDNPDDEEACELFLPRIGGEVDRLVDLVEGLLDIARGESGKLMLLHERVNLGELVVSVLRTFEPRARALRVTLDGLLEDVHIMGDADRLKQVGVNLVDNALRHTPPEGTVSLRVEKDEHEARFIVADTGIGIPYNDLPHIFKRFYVVDRSRARETGGTGLGLSIAKQIVEAHGGSITVDSELGQGATFTCTFPLSR